MAQCGQLWSRGVLATVLALALAVVALSAPLDTKSNAAQTIAFEKSIRPVLLARCVPCHSKDTSLGDVRLDQPITAATGQKLLAAITYTNASKMPPSGPLPAAEKKALSSWIQSGAPWPASSKTASVSTLKTQIQTHWAFQPIRLPAIPPVRHTAWATNPIDRFVLAKLEAANIIPSPKASKTTLIRRAYYDLIGLPPSPADVRAFVADTKPDAYRRLIDKLLASPKYGEKWGRHWLDLIRFAETNSYERDDPKPNVWRFRDYVIKSFNEDKPFNTFMQEQLAGDELPNAAADQLVATGFYRLGIWDDEPSDAELARYDGLDDLVATVGQAFLGLTLDCARCHNHKLDPIPQADYYRFLSFFQGITMFTNGGAGDVRPLYTSITQRTEMEAKVVVFEKKLAEIRQRQAVLETAYGRRRDKDAISNADLSDIQWTSYAGSGDKLPDFTTAKSTGSGVLTPALIDVAPARKKGNVVLAYEMKLRVSQSGKATFYLDSDDGSRLYVDGKQVIDYGGSHGEGNEKRADIDLETGQHTLRIEYLQTDESSPLGLSVAWSMPSFTRRPLSVWLSTSDLGRTQQMAHDSKRFVSEGEHLELAASKQQLKEMEAHRPAPSLGLVVTEGGARPRDTHILLRGVHSNKGVKVEPGYPVCAGGITPPLDEPDKGPTSLRRLALATWITSSQNVLTRRVLVNRVWQYHFGRGIVRSSNNFGLAGDRPTHPELLDFLATQLEWDGWSIKELHRLIMTSNTYMQASTTRPDIRKKDTNNDLFYRFDMRRLESEEVRDSILDVAGILNTEMYGPSVYPDIEQEVLNGQSIPGKDWHPDRNSAQQKNRRSIYVFLKRTLLYPLLESFDLPETDRTTPVRFASTQPTQALTMMNSKVLTQASNALYERVTKEGYRDLQSFTRRVLELTLQRTVPDAEVSRAMALSIRMELRGVSTKQAQIYLCLMALNFNEFIYLD